MPNLVKTLILFFLQYDVLLRTPSLPLRAYLVHFVRQFFMFLNQNSGFGKLKGYLTKFFTASKCYQYKIIQMCLGLKDLLHCV